MIRANELMVGDWVMLYDKPRKVEIIYDSNRVQTDCIEEDCEAVEPIPLTPEILEKNGFVEKNYIAETLGYEIFGYEENLCGVSYDDEDDWWFSTFVQYTICDYDGSPEDWGFCEKARIPNIKYVHELQHALRLCGIDIEIKL